MKKRTPNTPSPNDTTSHKQQLLAHMVAGGTLTRQDAVRICLCFDLSQRMGDLICDGVPVIKTWETNQKTGKRYKRYSLPVAYTQQHTA